MRFAKFSRTLLPLALPVVLATCAFAQEHPNVSPNAVRNLLTQQGGAHPQAAPAPAPEPVRNTAKAPAKAKRREATAADSAKPKAAKKTPGKAGMEKAPEKAEAANPGKGPAEKPAEAKGPVARRDPFDPLLTKSVASNAPPENLPPGKAGLVVSSLRINGIVTSKTGMIAIVSNSQQRVYFLREGDKLYDGSVEKITLEAVSFQEFGKDAFGKPLERQVTKRLYPSPGEQQ